jgi:MraZ protein
MLIGEYIHAIDEKNRVSLPAKFKSELGKKVVLAPGLDGSIFMFSVSEWEKISSKLAENSMLQADNRSFNRYMFGGAQEVEVDGSGRILIPDFLKSRGRLSGKIAIIGVQNRAEIWNERAWAKYKLGVEGQAETLAEKLGNVGAL